MSRFKKTRTTPTGEISVGDIHTELGTAGERSLGQADGRELAEVPTGVISMSDYRGKTSRSPIITQCVINNNDEEGFLLGLTGNLVSDFDNTDFELKAFYSLNYLSVNVETAVTVKTTSNIIFSKVKFTLEHVSSGNIFIFDNEGFSMTLGYYNYEGANTPSDYLKLLVPFSNNGDIDSDGIVHTTFSAASSYDLWNYFKPLSDFLIANAGEIRITMELTNYLTSE